jgi:hypothetical protein
MMDFEGRLSSPFRYLKYGVHSARKPYQIIPQDFGKSFTDFRLADIAADIQTSLIGKVLKSA